ncbi:4Fe-4S binding protein [Dehalogenimonas sp. THU2]|uniref:4Fe-4S binding protein n=1 Tax=Dehalogenimonas sp. THU2 TaxID=3151121 RepID=UPI0032181992
MFKRHVSRAVFALAVVALLGAAIYGQFSHGLSGFEPFLPDSVPGAVTFNALRSSGGTVLFVARDADGQDLSYVTAAEGPGYGGPMTVLVNWTLDGVITGVTVPEHHEDIPWWRALEQRGFFQQYNGRGFIEPLRLNEDIDAATGSTVSSNGVAVGVRAGRGVLASHLGQPFTGPGDPIQFGTPEIAVIAGILSVVLLRTIPLFRRLTWARGTMLAYSLVVFGIWLSVPLSLTNIAAWLVGYAPPVETFIMIYIIVFGILGLAVVLGKNFYCFWLCPYVAVQELIHSIFRVRIQPDVKWFKFLRNARYLLLFIALFLVLALKNPSVSVFEPWNVLFSLKGTADQWVLMIFALGAAIFIYDFWCHYLCPIGAVMDIILRVRRGVIELWHKNNKSAASHDAPRTSS